MKERVLKAPLLLDTQGAADYLGISKSMMRSYITNGVFELVRLPTPDGKGTVKKNLIRREDLDRWVSEQAKAV